MTEIGIDRVIEMVRERVREGRLNGQYPPGLEQQLDWEFQHLITAAERRLGVSQILQVQIASLEKYLEVSDNKDEATHRLKDIVRNLVEFARKSEDADERLVLELNRHIMDRVAVVDHLAILMVAMERRLERLEDGTGSLD